MYINNRILDKGCSYYMRLLDWQCLPSLWSGTLTTCLTKLFESATRHSPEVVAFRQVFNAKSSCCADISA